MPTLVKKYSAPRLKGVVTVNGQRREKVFPDNSQKSYRAAVQWEDLARKGLLMESTSTATVSVTLLAWSNEYLDYSDEAQSKKTYLEKKATFQRFVRQMGPTTSVEDLTLPGVMQFLRVQNRTRSGYAANRDRKNLAAGWGWGRKYMANFPRTPNPFLETDRFAEVRSPRYVPAEADFWTAFHKAEGQDKVILMTALHLGLRKSELYGIMLDDLDLTGRNIRVSTCKREGGTTEFDTLPLTETLARALEEWIRVRPVNSDHLFVNLGKEEFAHPHYGKAIVSRQHFMNKLCARSGVKPFGLHAIRHLTATTVFNEGQPLSVIQAILRHKSPATTMRYLHSLGLNQTREALSSVMERRDGTAPAASL